MNQRFTKAKLSHLGVTPSKRRGQNFLLDPARAITIADFADIKPAEWVLEIGPGLGMLTGELAKKTSNLTLVEVDRKLHAALLGKFPYLDPQEILCQDISKVDLSSLSHSRQQKCTVVGNIPYSISTEIIFWILKHRAAISRVSLLMQKEFANRLSSQPGSKSYGSITIQLALHANVRLGPIIKGEQFYPSTKVDSQLIMISMLDSPSVAITDPLHFERVVRTCFSTRRKTMLNCLTLLDEVESKTQALGILSTANISPTRRPETLEPHEFAAICNALSTLSTSERDSFYAI